jgi:hypothetical protein
MVMLGSALLVEVRSGYSVLNRVSSGKGMFL